MFQLCSGTSYSPIRQTENEHLNPIYHKLGGRKGKKKSQQIGLKKDQPCLTEQSISYTCPPYKIKISRHERTISDLGESKFKSMQINQKTHMTHRKERIDTHSSFAQPSQMQSKYNQLQEKYIGVLERTNFYLEKVLQQRQGRSENKTKSKSQSKNKISGQLQQLKNRLNNIDLSNLNKMTSLSKDTELKRGCPQQNKQNQQSSIYKQLRSKIS